MPGPVYIISYVDEDSSTLFNNWYDKMWSQPQAVWDELTNASDWSGSLPFDAATSYRRARLWVRNNIQATTSFDVFKTRIYRTLEALR